MIGQTKMILGHQFGEFLKEFEALFDRVINLVFLSETLQPVQSFHGSLKIIAIDNGALSTHEIRNTFHIGILRHGLLNGQGNPSFVGCNEHAAWIVGCEYQRRNKVLWILPLVLIFVLVFVVVVCVVIFAFYVVLVLILVLMGFFVFVRSGFCWEGHCLLLRWWLHRLSVCLYSSSLTKI